MPILVCSCPSWSQLTRRSPESPGRRKTALCPAGIFKLYVYWVFNQWNSSNEILHKCPVYEIEDLSRSGWGWAWGLRWAVWSPPHPSSFLPKWQPDLYVCQTWGLGVKTTPIMDRHLCGLGIWQTWVWIQLLSLNELHVLGQVIDLCLSFFFVKMEIIMFIL